MQSEIAKRLKLKYSPIAVLFCQITCLIPWEETGKERPQAVVGMIDADLLAFSVPFGMFKEMEDNVPGSFLDKQACLAQSSRADSGQEVNKRKLPTSEKKSLQLECV